MRLLGGVIALARVLPGAARAQYGLQGQASVSPSGAAAYNIPVAPMVSGMGPALSLAYNSGSCNGLPFHA